MGVFVMVAAAVGALVAGLRGMPWYLLILAGAVWTAGYFLHKPQALRKASDRGGSGELILMVLAACSVQAGIAYGLGALTRRLW